RQQGQDDGWALSRLWRRLPGLRHPGTEFSKGTVPLLVECCCGAVPSPVLISLDDPGVRQGGKAESAGVAHVSGQGPSSYATERGDEVEQPPVRALLQENPVPLVLQVQAPCRVAAG